MKTESNSALTTDTLLVIRDKSGNVLYHLNLSNKMNTLFRQSSTSSSRAIKLRTTTVNAFLKEHEDWSGPLFNTISYHWDTSLGQRVDYLNYKGGLARQSLGLQILYDHLFGTREKFSYYGDIFKDEVQLISYGTKIIASTQVLKQALFTKAMNDKNKLKMAYIDRSSWFKNGNDQNITNVIDEYDAQKRILQFDLIYSQTINFDNTGL